MSSRTGNLMIGMGAVVLFMGVIVLPAALGDRPEPSLIAVGACGISLGSVIAALGIYVKARAMQVSNAPGASSGESRNATRRVRGGCDVCHGDRPVIHCRVHQAHLCPDCLTQHYDFRTCTYVPSTRRAGSKTGKSVAKARGA